MVNIPARIVTNTFTINSFGFVAALTACPANQAARCAPLFCSIKLLSCTDSPIPYRNEACPFIVHAKDLDMKVLGTSFNVMAYGDESKVQTTLVSGSVRVVLDQSDKTVLLTPGHQAEMDKNSGKITMREVNVENYIGWKDKLFMFDEEDMVTIMNKLARWYDVDIIIETPELKEKVFYGVIRKYENISTILDMLKKTQNIDYLIEGKKIVIKEVR